MTQEYLGRPVLSLQTMLRTVARVNPSIPLLLPDGVYGEQTMRTVGEFQRQNGLETTGITDFETWKKIRDAYEEANTEAAAAQPLEIILNCHQVLLPESRNRHIYIIQAMFMALSADYDALKDVRVTGIFDIPTQRAVRWLQSCSGTTASGIFTKANWKMLAGLYTHKIGDGETEKDLQP